jgi:plasmid stabilization system protein ParE
MLKAIILPFAKRDISEAAKWYNSKQKGLGKRFTQEVRSKVLFIQENPEATALKYDKTRCAVLDVFPFMVHYIIENNKILVTAVFHTSLDPENWLSR